MTFEWDENKNSENKAKHKVSFEKAQDAFFDVNRTIRGQNIRIFGAGYWRQGKKRYEEHLQ